MNRWTWRSRAAIGWPDAPPYRRPISRARIDRRTARLPAFDTVRRHREPERTGLNVVQSGFATTGSSRPSSPPGRLRTTAPLYDPVAARRRHPDTDRRPLGALDRRLRSSRPAGPGRRPRGPRRSSGGRRIASGRHLDPAPGVAPIRSAGRACRDRAHPAERGSAARNGLSMAWARGPAEYGSPRTASR